MKKLLLSLVALTIISFSIVSCGSKSDPKAVAENFLNALSKMDYEGAKKYGTPETGKMLDMLSSFSSMMPDSVKNKAKDVKVEIKNVKEDGDKCDVTYKNSEKEEDQTLNLVKKDGKWLVNMTKDETMGAGEDTEAPLAPTDEAVPMTDSVKIDGDSTK
ncbi:MAG TPA: DUF4878 domain-containing protein [Chitinophagaceae bacterium]|jgi:hypothetical protein|nr:DUF4878 domain-containing protein [Chitinophagaceae bacterium]